MAKAYATVVCHPGHELEDEESAVVHCDGRHWNKQPSKCLPTPSDSQEGQLPFCYQDYFERWTSEPIEDNSRWEFELGGMHFRQGLFLNSWL